MVSHRRPNIYNKKRGVVAVDADWLTIRNDYINGGGSYRKLAEKYKVKFSALREVALKEEWVAAKAEQMDKIRNETAQKTAEKIAESEAEIAAIRSRLRLKFMQEIERRAELEETDGMEFRRLVQSYKDMCEITDGIGTPEENDDGFLEALNGTAGEDWNDEGDIPI